MQGSFFNLCILFCRIMLNFAKWSFWETKLIVFSNAIEYGKGHTFGELADGINNGTLCSWGIKNEDTGIYTVSTKIITSKFDIPIYLWIFDLACLSGW